MSLTSTQKQLRKSEKKIRLLKSKENWNMTEINKFEIHSEELRKKIKRGEKDSIEKEKMNSMEDEYWIDYFKEEQAESKTDTNIPNTKEMRILRKKTIQKLNEHLLAEHMDNQIKIRMNIIQQLKDQLNEEDNHSKCEDK
jgi:hypothetical protein